VLKWLKDTFKYGLDPKNNPEKKLYCESILQWHTRRMRLLTSNKLEKVIYMRNLMYESANIKNKKLFYCFLMDLLTEGRVIKSDDNIGEEDYKKLWEELIELHDKSTDTGMDSNDWTRIGNIKNYP
jgi:hypothetical protein